MHFDKGGIPEGYAGYISRKWWFLCLVSVMLVCLAIMGISLGAVKISLLEVVEALFRMPVSGRVNMIVYHIRLPQVLAAMITGAGLAASGAVLQSILRNPLGSPFTLGISHAAAFGAALSVMVLGSGIMGSSLNDAVNISNPALTTGCAFVFAMGAAWIIITISGYQKSSPETMVLTGVALGSLFTAGTMLLQFFADDVQLAAMVFWTFGDVARADYKELGIISAVTLPGIVYFMLNAWNYNAMDAGDDTAKGIGVHVVRTRLLGMTVASVLISVSIAFVGIIGFVGLVAPHMVRRLIGDDNRFLIPGTAAAGACLLLLSDTAARLVLSPHILPVSVLTSFLGAPVFIAMIMRGKKG
ncbi:MAG: iron ABC transporter permease [Desulfobacteraceae bacterium]|nr:MAG: iron ABC transporter permease [Desulfobacteraceae bacterium]